ncbi:MAG: hypothetical protein IV107_15670 [Paucibacter sp.]|nr:hypothetical protein [Roseateles sp.]
MSNLVLGSFFAATAFFAGTALVGTLTGALTGAFTAALVATLAATLTTGFFSTASGLLAAGAFAFGLSLLAAADGAAMTVLALVLLRDLGAMAIGNLSN